MKENKDLLVHETTFKIETKVRLHAFVTMTLPKGDCSISGRE